MNIEPWDKLGREEQDLYLSLLWQDGHSEQAIADFLGATKGSIVRRRQTGLRLPTSGRPSVKTVVDPERFRDLLDLHFMGKMEERGVAVIAPVAAEQLQEPAQTVQLPPSESAPSKLRLVSVASVPDLTVCQWPLIEARSLKEQTICGKPAIGGLCEEHRKMIREGTFKRLT